MQVNQSLTNIDSVVQSCDCTWYRVHFFYHIQNLIFWR